MRVKKLHWISVAGKEAELLITDGKNECLAFSQPCDIALGAKINGCLHALDVEDFKRASDKLTPETIIRIPEWGYFYHYCVATVVDVEKNIVSIGKIIIELDFDIPAWTKAGDLVEFNCARLDIW